MVTRRSFIAAQLTAAAQSALSVHWPDLNSFAAATQSPAGTGRPSPRDFWNDWPGRHDEEDESSKKLQKWLPCAGSALRLRSSDCGPLRDRPIGSFGSSRKAGLTKTPLNARTMGTIERDEYRIEKARFRKYAAVSMSRRICMSPRTETGLLIRQSSHPWDISPDGKIVLVTTSTHFKTLAQKGICSTRL